MKGFFATFILQLPLRRCHSFTNWSSSSDRLGQLCFLQSTGLQFKTRCLPSQNAFFLCFCKGVSVSWGCNQAHSSWTVEIDVLIEMTTCELLCGDTFISSDREWWCVDLKTTPTIPDILLGTNLSNTRAEPTPSAIYNWIRILLFKHFALDVVLEWGLRSQLTTEVFILGNAGQFSEGVK